MKREGRERKKSSVMGESSLFVSLILYVVTLSPTTIIFVLENELIKKEIRV